MSSVLSDLLLFERTLTGGEVNTDEDASSDFSDRLLLERALRRGEVNDGEVRESVTDRREAGFFRPLKYGLSASDGGLAVVPRSPDDRDDFLRPRGFGLSGGFAVSRSDTSEDRELVRFGALRLF